MVAAVHTIFRTPTRHAMRDGRPHSSDGSSRRWRASQRCACSCIFFPPRCSSAERFNSRLAPRLRRRHPRSPPFRARRTAVSRALPRTKPRGVGHRPHNSGQATRRLSSLSSPHDSCSRECSHPAPTARRGPLRSLSPGALRALVLPYRAVSTNHGRRSVSRFRPVLWLHGRGRGPDLCE